MTAAAREYIRARIAVEDRGHSSECWIWQGALNEKGYARSRIPGINRTLRIHRFTYELYIGPIPDGLTIDHLCRVRCCVNPAHLEAVTGPENFQRAIQYLPRKTHCKCGVELTPEITVNRSKECKACRAAYKRRWTALRAVRSAAVIETGGGKQPGSAADLRTHEGPSRQSLGSAL